MLINYTLNRAGSLSRRVNRPGVYRGPIDGPDCNESSIVGEADELRWMYESSLYAPRCYRRTNKWCVKGESECLGDSGGLVTSKPPCTPLALLLPLLLLATIRALMYDTFLSRVNSQQLHGLAGQTCVSIDRIKAANHDQCSQYQRTSCYPPRTFCCSRAVPVADCWARRVTHPSRCLLLATLHRHRRRRPRRQHQGIPYMFNSPSLLFDLSGRHVTATLPAWGTGMARRMSLGDRLQNAISPRALSVFLTPAFIAMNKVRVSVLVRKVVCAPRGGGGGFHFDARNVM